MWYKENQILPIIKRLVQHIGEITLNQLCESLGIENIYLEFYQKKNNEQLNGNGNNNNNKKRIIVNLKVRSGLLFKCPNCKKIRHINFLKNRDDCIRLLTKCERCKYWFSKSEDYQIIANVIKNTAKNLIFLYYRKKSACSLCRESNNRTIFSDKTYNGYMEIGHDEIYFYQELQFLNELVNINEISNDSIIKSFNDAVKNVEKYINNINNQISFTKFNIREFLSF